MTIEGSKPILTKDGKTVYRGDRVFNYYDIEWGTITSDPGADGWFSFEGETLGSMGGHTNRLLNGERISTFQPAGMSQ